jgi:hypothetical protein
LQPPFRLSATYQADTLHATDQSQGYGGDTFWMRGDNLRIRHQSAPDWPHCSGTVICKRPQPVLPMITPNSHYGQASDLNFAQMDPQILTIAGLFLFMILVLGMKELAPVLPARFRKQLKPHPAVASTEQMARHAADVRSVRFEPVSILKREEARLLPALEDAVERLARGHRVLLQMSLAEMIRPEEASGTLLQRRAAADAIAAQKLDFAVVDRSGRLVLAIKYHGSGHYLPETYLRDTVAREAVQQAGIAYLEVQQGFDDDELFRGVHSILKTASGTTIDAPRAAKPIRA